MSSYPWRTGRSVGLLNTRGLRTDRRSAQRLLPACAEAGTLGEKDFSNHSLRPEGAETGWPQAPVAGFQTDVREVFGMDGGLLLDSAEDQVEFVEHWCVGPELPSEPAL